MKAADPATTPLKIQRLPEARTLRVEWADDHACEMPYDSLRKACPCATCSKEREETDTGLRVLTTEASHGPLQIDEISLVGAYAVRLSWSDGHDTGFYSFRFLRALCPHRCGGAEGIRFESFRGVRDLLRQEGKDDEERRTPDGKPRQE